MEDVTNYTNVVEIKISKTDLPVPVINHVHLHSIYNPEREAEGFISANENVFAKSSKVLVFGLGFGYHLAKLEQRLKSLYPNNYEIFVIEPNRDLYEKWKDMRPTMFSPRTRVVCYDTVKDFYKDLELVEFMSEKPAILPHQASFQLNETFYRSFMSYHYPSALNESLSFIQSEDFKEYLMMADTKMTTDEFFQQTREKTFLQGYDFLTMALSEMVTTEKSR
jgi:hypothetical protein